MLFDFGVPLAALAVAAVSVLWVRHESHKLDQETLRQRHD